MKILHTADWHLDAPLSGQGPALRQSLAAVPGKILEIFQREACDLVLISGDVFDGAYTAHTYQTLYTLFQSMAVPVFIAPGNHDCADLQSPWKRELWPENVHIFKSARIESVVVPEMNLRVYGAGFESMDCQALLENFRANGPEKYAVGVFHGDATQVKSAYNPITAAQVQDSGLDYLALGHIHKADSFRAGKTLCAWPGCPMGRGYDEQGEKGVYVITLENTATAKFVPLDTPRFYDFESKPEEISGLLPPVPSEDYYRVTLVGACDAPDLAALQGEYAHLPNLIFRDKTTRPADIWSSVGEDSFAGTYFGLLKQMLDEASDEEKEEILLAAKLSRSILEGEEVVLP